MRRISTTSTLKLRVAPLARSYGSAAGTSPTVGSATRLTTLLGGGGALLVGGTAVYMTSSASNVGAAEKEPIALDNKDEWKQFKLCHSDELTHDTKKFRFLLPSKAHKTGLPVASCIMVRAPIGEKGAPVVRPYTPTTSDDEKGYFDLIIKNYPEKGVMSKHIHSLKPGDIIEVKGAAIPKIPITKNMKKNIGMLAGGTGITPMYQVIREILKKPDDKTQISLVFANHTDQDIILKKELDELAAKHPNFKVHYVVTKAPSKWTGGVGHVNADVIKKYMPEPSDDNIVFVCGPPGFYTAVSGPKAKDYSQGEVDGYLKELGYKKEQVFKF